MLKYTYIMAARAMAWRYIMVRRHRVDIVAYVYIREC